MSALARGEPCAPSPVSSPGRWSSSHSTWWCWNGRGIALVITSPSPGWPGLRRLTWASIAATGSGLSYGRQREQRGRPCWSRAATCRADPQTEHGSAAPRRRLSHAEQIRSLPSHCTSRPGSPQWAHRGRTSLRAPAACRFLISSSTWGGPSGRPEVSRPGSSLSAAARRRCCARDGAAREIAAATSPLSRDGSASCTTPAMTAPGPARNPSSTPVTARSAPAWAARRRCPAQRHPRRRPSSPPSPRGR